MSDREELVQEIVRQLRDTLAQRRRHPNATYRLQLNAGFTFPDAASVIPYLRALGVSDVYASPLLAARPGSPHGYDVCDHGHLNPELGSAEEYLAYLEALRLHGMGQILDIVPNHMAVTARDNALWTDVLENGQSSPFARYFDIHWRPHKEELRNKVLLPVLGAQYGEVLESGDLKLEYAGGAFRICYFQHRFPVEPRSASMILAHRLEELRGHLENGSEAMQEYESILNAVELLPHHTTANPERAAVRQREKEVIKRRLGRLTAECQGVARFLQQKVDQFNVSPDDSAAVERLDKLLDAQPYRLSYWKVAADEINYRRFFDINDLAALCMEDIEVFQATHSLVLDMLVRGEALGLRIDHIDGLFDPHEYLLRLQGGFLRSLAASVYSRLAEHQRPDTSSAPSAPGEGVPSWSELESAALTEFHSKAEAELRQTPLYTVVEKILGVEEPLPDEWPVDGTTGYDFLKSLNGLFIDPAGLAETSRTYQRFIGDRIGFAEVAYRCKLLILDVAMSSELQMLAYRLNRISEQYRSSRDFTLNALRHALREILACFPVYRTYVRSQEIADRDRRFVQLAVAQAKRRNPAMDFSVFDFIRQVLLLEHPPGINEEARRERETFVGRFQQVTSPVMAKGVEDTAFYVYCPLVSLNEVGAEPHKAQTTLREFHQDNLERLSDRPYSLICTSTHDTKRSEDVRARIDVLSEIPHLWRGAVNRWARLNRRFRRETDGHSAPTRKDEYVFYQTLVGVWPLEPASEETHAEFITRLQTYMGKATREAKEITSWTNPNPAYDQAVADFVARALERRKNNKFLESFQAFHEQVIRWGLYTALSQTLLKLTSPGIPDVYQGQELWDFSLVDPDNRRPVDFDGRRRLLNDLEAEVAAGQQQRLAQHLGQHPQDPRSKLFVTWRALQLRKTQPNLFAEGAYLPLPAEGQRADHVCAFARRLSAPDSGDRLAVVVAPRLLARLTPPELPHQPSPPPLGPEIWGDTCLPMPDLPAGPWEDLFSGRVLSAENGRFSLGNILSSFPVAVLVPANPALG